MTFSFPTDFGFCFNQAAIECICFCLDFGFTRRSIIIVIDPFYTEKLHYHEAVWLREA